MGHERGLDRGVAAEGAAPRDAGDVHQGGDAGQAGAAQPLRLPGVQDAPEGAHLRVDVQPQVEGEAGQVGARRGRPTPTDIIVYGEQL